MRIREGRVSPQSQVLQQEGPAECSEFTHGTEQIQVQCLALFAQA